MSDPISRRHTDPAGVDDNAADTSGTDDVYQRDAATGRDERSTICVAFGRVHRPEPGVGIITGEWREIGRGPLPMVIEGSGQWSDVKIEASPASGAADDAQVYQRALHAYEQAMCDAPRWIDAFRAAVDEARRDLQQQLDAANATIAQHIHHTARLQAAVDSAGAEIAAAVAARDEAQAQLAAVTGDGGEWQYGYIGCEDTFVVLDGETAAEALADPSDRVHILRRRKTTTFGPVEPVTEEQR